MASRTPGGRRKQAKPQRKVELEMLNNENREPIPPPSTSSPLSPMSPDNNHNELLNKRLKGVNEEVLNGLSMHSPPKVAKSGGAAEDPPNDLISAKAAVGEQSEDLERIKEYLKRSDTAVIYPEPVGHSENVSPLTSGASGKESGDDLNVSPEYCIKCPQCQKGCQSFQAFKEHMETAHGDSSATSPSENRPLSSTPSAVSPTPSMGGPAGPLACSQCTASFATKDHLEKHELLHSPNAQVSCKICNKTFANVYRLQRHMISHDESAVLRKFKCTECDKAFKFKHHLKEHIRIHSGEKPFECPNCGKRFSHSGSYSSHMTSKKCLVMNLKLGRTRTPSGTTLLDKSPSQHRSMKRTNMSPMNNNIATSPNHNSYLPILPKYSEAAAAFLQSSLTNPSLSPFYLTPPGLLNTGHSITPYSMPNLSHLFEQLQQSASPLRPPLIDTHDHNPDDFKSRACTSLLSKDNFQETEVAKSNASSCGELVMDEDLDHDNVSIKNEPQPHESIANNGDLEAVKRILETVNATVTKELLQANMHKFASESSSDCNSISSVHSPKQEPFHCNTCKKSFDSSMQLEEHECDQIDIKSEGLAAKLEDIITIKSENVHNGSVSGNEDGDYDRAHDKNEDEMDCESVTTTDHVSEDGRKVRVRSLISDEQLKVLKDNYRLNPRPKREDLEKIADAIGFQVRVVQVWFQNTRARDRREGRLIQVPYSPAPAIPIRYPVPPSQSLSHKIVPSLNISGSYNSEQPLDLSTKKGNQSVDSSPTSSPRRPTSVSHYPELGEEVVNLSRKSSRSPTPYIYPGHYQSSNSSDPRQSPSPIDFHNSSRLAQILAQPAHKFAGMGLMPMEQLMQLGAADLPSLSQLLTNRLNSLSPNSKKSMSSEREMGGDGFQEIEGQFSCDQCDKSFSKQSSLARHKYEHSGQRPHKCDECPKAFKHKHHLTEHKRLHSGEKPFQCIKCLKRFSHSGSYSQHMNHRYSYCKPYRE